MTHLVDSDVLIDAVEVRRDALNALERIGPRNLGISAISVGEFLDGVMLEPDAQRRREEFERFLEPMRILNVDELIMIRFASVRAELRRRGQLIADFDIVITATAILIALRFRHKLSSTRRSIMGKSVTLALDRESEIGRALEDPEVNEVTVVLNGRYFKMVEEDKKRFWETHSFADLVREIGNPFEGMDTEKLKEDIYRWRLEGSRHNFEE